MVHHPVGAFDRILYAAERRIEARIADRHVRQVLVFHSPCRQLAQEFRKILFRRRVGDLRDDAEFVAADAVAVADLGEHGVDRAADLGKHRVAHAMAKGVVDGLELVHVEIVDDCVPAQRGETALIAAAVQKMSERVDFLRELGIQDVNHQNIDR